MDAWLGRLARKVEEMTGLASFYEAGEAYLASHSLRRARELGITPSALAGRMELEPSSSPEWRRLISGMTNGQTSFFRDREQFEVMGRILEEAGAEKGEGMLQLWSCGCATGEEAYSLAILCRQRGLKAQILATDINEDFLARARAAVYAPWSLRNVDASLLPSFFENEGERFRVGRAARSMVRFERHNLALDPPMLPEGEGGGWDLIVCRNVLMYFRRERAGEISRRLALALAPYGCLLLAACESLHGLDLPLVPHGVERRVVYRPGEALRTASGLIGRGGPPPGRRPEERVLPSTASSCAVLKEDQSKLRRPLPKPAEATGLGGLLDMGHLHMKEHRFEAALEVYERAALTEPLHFESHMFKGLAFRKQGRWEEAAHAFRRALFLAPACWRAAYLLAGVYERLGRPEAAARERTSARRVLEQNAGALAFLSTPSLVDLLFPSEEEARLHLAGLAQAT
ncbi:MAG: CheR family methyltransferase, partial [Myxococcota bacterium]